MKKQPVKHEIACYLCGNIGDLLMLAHRNNNKRIAGWVFICQGCFPKLAGKKLSITPTNGDKPE